jgi:Flp pilus assembly pilin Flp
MATALRRLIKTEKGQALLEYQVLFPAAILLVIAAAWLIGPNISDVYRHVASVMLGPKECVVFNPEEQGNDYCDHHEDCEKAEWEEMDQGSYEYSSALTVETAVIKAGKTYEIRRDDPFKFQYETDDGCYRVTFKTNKVEWERIGTGDTCQGVSHVDIWQAPICQ